MVLGTPRYMAPEARAGAPAEPRSDVFAVGVLLQEMLGVSAGAPSRLRSRLEAIARHASAADPSERYRDAVALLHALDGDASAFAERASNDHCWLSNRAGYAPWRSRWRARPAVSIYALLLSVTPRTLAVERNLAAGRLRGAALGRRSFGDARALRDLADALGSRGLGGGARGVRRAARSVAPRAARERGSGATGASVGAVLRMAVVLNVLFLVHLVLERTALRSLVIYIPILGGMLELAMVYLVWVAVLECLRTSRPLRREPWLWVGALISLVPPVVSSFRLLRGGQP